MGKIVKIDTIDLSHHNRFPLAFVSFPLCLLKHTTPRPIVKRAAEKNVGFPNVSAVSVVTLLGFYVIHREGVTTLVDVDSVPDESLP